jgi:hypothetical protein
MLPHKCYKIDSAVSLVPVRIWRQILICGWKACLGVIQKDAAISTRCFLRSLKLTVVEPDEITVLARIDDDIAWPEVG